MVRYVRKGKERKRSFDYLSIVLSRENGRIIDNEYRTEGRQVRGVVVLAVCGRTQSVLLECTNRERRKFSSK